MVKSVPKWLLPTLLAFLVPALLVGFGVNAIAKGPGAAGPAAASQSKKVALPGNPQTGQQVYTSAPCAACHGASLAGTSGLAPSLNPIERLHGVSNPLDPNYMITTITNGRTAAQAHSDGFGGAMPAKGGGNLSTQQIKDLAAYIINLNLNPNSATLSPQELSRSTVQWVVMGIIAMVILTWLLARYNMRWIARKAAQR